MDNLDLIPIPEIIQRLSSSRQTIYNEIETGRLKTVKIGRRRYSTKKFINEYIELLENEAEKRF